MVRDHAHDVVEVVRHVHGRRLLAAVQGQERRRCRKTQSGPVVAHALLGLGGVLGRVADTSAA